MTDKKLKSLIDHDRERIAVWEAMHPKKCNGIACPKCGDEMYDLEVFGGVAMCMDAPPRVGVSCACGYQGHRLA